jgi:hypothetical protein
VIAETEVEKAVDYLRSSAKEAAQARAEVKYLGEFLKAKKAQLAIGFKNANSAAAAEHAALADPAYHEVLEGYKVAVENDAFHTFKREAADALIRAWQTQCSNQRTEARVYG